MKKLFLFLSFVSLTIISNAQYTKLLDFSGTADGQYPFFGPLFSDGAFLYGMTVRGGINSDGVVFKIKPDGTGYSKLLDFGGTANGIEPNGSLISDGTFLYGMTAGGGINNNGVIFKIKPDGTGYSKLLDFADTANGSYPQGSLISDGTFLYGMTLGGGINNNGVIFKIKPDGTGYSKLLDFAGTANGSHPYGSLISDGIFLYGMTGKGGINDYGIIFKIKPDGTGYSKLLDFAGTTNGSYPWGSLIFDGIFLYGMTWQGGTNNTGTVFKIKPDGTDYANLLDFVGANGKWPYGSLFSDGTFLYGMTEGGGTDNMGTVFKIKPDGTGYDTLLNFNSANGSYPLASLISDGTCLYGMTQKGGNYDLGVIFKLGLVTSIAENPVKGGTETDFTIYPNPATNKQTIECLQQATIEITNIQGQTILRQQLQQSKTDIDVSGLAKGVYFLRLNNNDKTKVTKILKE